MPHERDIDHAIVRLAEAQHGVVARRQLLALGLGSDAIVHRTRSGRLVVLHRGVYAVGHRALRHEGRLMAAVLAAGAGAGLNLRSAGELWDLRTPGARGVHVAVPSQAGRRARPGITVHRIPTIAAHLTSYRGVPVTTIPRTLFDLAGTERPHILRRAVERAEQLGRFDLRPLVALIDAQPRHAGVPALRALLRDYGLHGMTYTRSDLEARFLELCLAYGLPRPQVNRSRNGHEVDFSWPEHGLVVEVDSWRYHGTRAAFARDRARDRAQLRAGVRVARVTEEEIVHGPAELAAELRALLEMNGWRGGGA